MWVLLQFISGSIQKNALADFLPVMKLFDLLYPEKEVSLILKVLFSVQLGTFIDQYYYPSGVTLRTVCCIVGGKCFISSCEDFISM